MTREKLLSVLEIAKELNTGKVTIKFSLKRFKRWLPYDLIEGQPLYPRETIKKLFMIQEKLEMGILPSDIEKELDVLDNSNSDDILNHFEDTFQNGDLLSHDGLNLLKSVFHDIGTQQARIAVAHEKRAAAEERKVDALEKRAAAEEKKADAMNNIANALQEMNKIRASDPAGQVAHKVVQQAASVIALDQTIDETFVETINGTIDESNKEETQIELDDLSYLIQGSNASDEPIDDLSSLLEENDVPEEENTPKEEHLNEDNSMEELDDLSLLLDEPKEPNVQIDDLYKLIDDEVENHAELPLDDLSALIDQNEAIAAEPMELDDLSKLIDSEQNLPLDDLSLLIDDNNSIPMDDLSLLIDDFNQAETENIPEIKVDISPEENIKGYKAAILKIIIGLKTEGLGVKEVTNRLNKNQIKTLSGKSEWSQKAISQIYKFIESAK